MIDLLDQPKIDCHAHVLDPARFPYGKDIAYHPEGQEIGTPDQLVQVMDAYGITHTLLVQPNSGYGPDNGCLLDAIERYPGRFTGIAIVAPDADMATLTDLKARGVVGVAFNPTLYGTGYYAGSERLVRRLADLDMIVNIQVEGDQIGMFRPWFEDIPVRVLVDHCGRPTPSAGLDQPGFRTLLDLAETDRVWVKVSGYLKFARTPYRYEEAEPFVRALFSAYSARRCLWASDWPYLRADERQDVGALLQTFVRFVPDPSERRAILWDTPSALLGERIAQP